MCVIAVEVQNAFSQGIVRFVKNGGKKRVQVGCEILTKKMHRPK